MRLQQLNRNEDSRRITLAAVTAGIIGGMALIPAVLNGASRGFDADALAGVAVGVLFLALAAGIHLRSRASAAAALGLFVALRLVAVLTMGVMALVNLWFWIGVAILAAGTRAAFEENRARRAISA